jgi:uncharacterized membrane protein YhaH (DUF805 family)
MNTETHQPPLSRQLWIKQRCIQVENLFNGRSHRAAFLSRALPCLAILALVYWNGTRESTVLPGWFTIPFAILACFLAMLAFSHRFHDLGLGAANMLQIILPIAVWYTMAEKLPESFYLPTTIILFIWPMLVFLRLCLQPGKDGPTGFEKR